MHRSFFLSLLLLTGCPFVGESEFEREIADVDGDGSLSVRFGGPDCMDLNPLVTDCDADNDGVISDAAGGPDCDDTRSEVRPEAPERCDGLDNDCDGLVDNDDPDATGEVGVWRDEDGDGHGNPDAPVACQEQVDGLPLHSLSSADCDDTRADIGPDQVERCDGFDNDCDGVVDDVGLWFVDADGDGVGRDQLTEGACDLSITTGLSEVSGDCDDDDPTVRPGLDEVRYDGIDQNCNGGRDDWDGDFDGFVPPEHWASAQVASAEAPDGPWTLQIGDCDDDDPTSHPEGTEVCDGADNDCDTATDSEDLDPTDPLVEPTLYAQTVVVYIDGDQDGSAGAELRLCPGEVDPLVHSPTIDDCFDLGPVPPGLEGVAPESVHPGAPETCDGVDNDCDGLFDSADPDVDLATTPVWYPDADDDGWGVDDGSGFAQCDRPVLRASRLEDCDDQDPGLNPGAPWQRDLDQDGAGDPATATQTPDCEPPTPTGWTLDDQDCNDASDLYHPGTLWYADSDGDGFGSPTTVLNACNPGTGWVLASAGEDCNDADPHTLASTAYYLDLDGDGSGDAATLLYACSLPSPTDPWVTRGDDCDDDDAARHPLRIELCNDRDDDCDGHIDDADDDVVVIGEGVVGFRDEDEDGVGGVQQRRFCEVVLPGFAPISGDCDDHDATRSPLLAEVCLNGIDDDCDGAEQTPRWYADQDEDGYGSVLVATHCTQPVGTHHLQGDCDDEEDTVFPGAPEIAACDGVDQDCDGTPEPLREWSVDIDGDGLGEPLSTIVQCDAPGAGWVPNDLDCDDSTAGVGSRTSGFLDEDLDGAGGPVWIESCTPPSNLVATSEDCDDADPTRRPGYAERCGDGVDNDCDGVYLQLDGQSGVPGPHDERWDAPNPWTGAGVQFDPDAPTLGNYPLYIASVDGDAFFSLATLDVLCIAQPELIGIASATGSVPAIQPEENSLLTDYLDCERRNDGAVADPTDRGTLGAPDEDADGVPSFTDLQDLRLICGSNPPGIAPIDNDFNSDCNPTDPFERYSLFDRYPDGDGDGVYAAGRYVFDDCGFARPSDTPGADCDDGDKQTANGTDFFASSAGEIEHILTTCGSLPDGINLFVDSCNAMWPQAGPGSMPPPDGLILQGHPVFGDCADGFRSEGALPLVVHGDLTVRDIDLRTDLIVTGTLQMSSARFEGTLDLDGTGVFDNVDLIATDSAMMRASAGSYVTIVQSDISQHGSVLPRTATLVESQDASVWIQRSTVAGLGQVAELQGGSLTLEDVAVQDTARLVGATGVTPIVMDAVYFLDEDADQDGLIDVESGPLSIDASSFVVLHTGGLSGSAPMVSLGTDQGTVQDTTFWQEGAERTLWDQHDGALSLSYATLFQPTAVPQVVLGADVSASISDSLLYQGAETASAACPITENPGTMVIDSWSHNLVPLCMAHMSNQLGQTGFDANRFPTNPLVRGVHGHRP